MKNSREVFGGLVVQGLSEQINYSIDTTNWGGSPTSTSHDIFDEEDLDTSLKATLCSGVTSVASNVITLPTLSGGTEGKVYLVEVTFTSDGQVLIAYFRVKFERKG